MNWNRYYNARLVSPENKNNRGQNMGIFLDINLDINRMEFQNIPLFVKK